MEERSIATSATSALSRRMVASYQSYEQAQRAVDYLSDERFPVARVAIIGEGLQLVEQVTGRLTWWKAALNGLASGAFIGLFMGWLLGLFNLINPLVSILALAIWGLLFGALLGAVMGLLGYAATGGRRDFTSVGMMQAKQYNLLVDAEVADEAKRILDRLPPR
jgi:hypothetical protein